MHNYYTETQQRIKKIWSVKKKVVLLQPLFEKKNGVLAQVARAFDWQSKGHRFDSDILHQRGSHEPLFYFIFPL